MKNFKVKVDDVHVEFFKQLMDRLSFVNYEEVDAFHEPRIYPGADFEIRSGQTRKPQEVLKKSSKSNKELDAKSHSDTMDDIRSVISKIDKMRGHSK